MTIEKTLDGGTLTIMPAGRLDTVTSPDLEAELDVSLDGVNNLIFDLKDLEYISSAGLRVLLSAQKRMAEQGGMKITGVNDTVMEIFEVTGFTDIMNIQ